MRFRYPTIRNDKKSRTPHSSSLRGPTIKCRKATTNTTTTTTTPRTTTNTSSSKLPHYTLRAWADVKKQRVAAHHPTSDDEEEDDINININMNDIWIPSQDVSTKQTPIQSQPQPSRQSQPQPSRQSQKPLPFFFFNTAKHARGGGIQTKPSPTTNAVWIPKTKSNTNNNPTTTTTNTTTPTTPTHWKFLNQRIQLVKRNVVRPIHVMKHQIGSTMGWCPPQPNETTHPLYKFQLTKTFEQNRRYRAKQQNQHQQQRRSSQTTFDGRASIRTSTTFSTTDTSRRRSSSSASSTFRFVP